jgi:hypothetical protein
LHFLRIFPVRLGAKRAERLCRKCRSTLEIDDDLCRACGANNPVTLPWYTLPLGLVLWAIVIGFVVDFGEVWRWLDMVLGNAGGAPASGAD